MKKVKSSLSARVPAKSASKSVKSGKVPKTVGQGKGGPQKAAEEVRSKAGTASPKSSAQKLPAMKKAAATIKPAVPPSASAKPAIAPKKIASKPPEPTPSSGPAGPKRTKAGPATPPQVAAASPVKPAPKPASTRRGTTAKPKVESSKKPTAAAPAPKKAAAKQVDPKKTTATKPAKKVATGTSPVATAKFVGSASGSGGAKQRKLPPKKPMLANVPAILLEGDEPKRPAAGGPGTRFHLGGSDTPRDISDDFDLPDAYGTGKVFLAARDPQWLHAHWDLTLEQLRASNARSRSGCLMLRVFGDGALRQEINVHPEARTWFIHVGRGGLAYSVELGGYDRGGAWFTVSTSEEATTPPDSLAEDVEPEFAERETVVGAASEEEITLRPIPPKIPAGGATASEASPSPKRDTAAGTKSPRGGRREFARWTPAQAAAMDESVTMTAVKKTWGASGEITELLAQRRERALASAAAAGKSAAAAGIPEGGPGEAGGMSSQEAVPVGRPPGFWFNVNAELIVYGATEPDARVTIGGRAVRLRPDGTFSFRFALPDGEYELPIEAAAADGHDGRRAELEFARATHYVGDVEVHPQDPALKPPKPEHTS